MRCALVYVMTAVLLAACGGMPMRAGSDAVVPVLMLGEQHDAPEHQQLHRDVVDALVQRGVLAALVVEMAERGRSTLSLQRDASESDVQQALAWKAEGGWPWPQYGPAVMTAVRAGVPVFGANITVDELRAARGDEQLDRLVPADALQRTRESIRAGHCDLLPASQLAPMARIQIARDRSMAQAIERVALPGKTVVLVAGSGHVDPKVGVPLHLPRALQAQPVLLPRVDTGKDYCGELRRQMPRQG